MTGRRMGPGLCLAMGMLIGLRKMLIKMWGHRVTLGTCSPARAAGSNSSQLFLSCVHCSSMAQICPNPPKSPAPLQQRLAALFRPSPSSSDKPIAPVSPQPSGNPELGLKANISQSLLRDTSSFHGQF